MLRLGVGVACILPLSCRKPGGELVGYDSGVRGGATYVRVVLTMDLRELYAHYEEVSMARDAKSNGGSKK